MKAELLQRRFQLTPGMRTFISTKVLKPHGIRTNLTCVPEMSDTEGLDTDRGHKNDTDDTKFGTFLDDEIGENGTLHEEDVEDEISLPSKILDEEYSIQQSSPGAEISQLNIPMIKEVKESLTQTCRRRWVAGQQTIDLSTRVHILVVDDSDLERNMLTQLIRNYNPDIRIDEARDGMEGFRKVKSNYKKGQMYHQVFIDLNMPVCDGFGSISQIRAYEKQNKIDKCQVCLLSTDDLREEDDDHSKDHVGKLKIYGIQRFLLKPLSMQTLNKILSDYSERKIGYSSSMYSKGMSFM